MVRGQRIRPAEKLWLIEKYCSWKMPSYADHSISAYATKFAFIVYFRFSQINKPYTEINGRIMLRRESGNRYST